MAHVVAQFLRVFVVSLCLSSTSNNVLANMPSSLQTVMVEQKPKKVKEKFGWCRLKVFLHGTPTWPFGDGVNNYDVF